ncbi:Zn(II)2Cys6 transcription factor domain-containing protein KNAG_0C05620 [Huiozyma naganishii CBS 8797]|uniref:Zn(2)-C6 fungal-type domain-containing protein n=1 Tax=Huiozyma naganishii (strain ATCC MYA-139 / BCRC 22969 / CBS 8797 / KCTC 17520 / NBRC 10181 / NCYC 3082 / Yp74L-3) TaxID=1071383 RepID=J7R487_HUIN7|nr:hypothetical protein KNAG_0C05620 [Kazachstania naganishii CBS 8797]CCK69660.1 hypothetical protein KNAG_0C05620 [Kazachstania naganishii CBS 8797]
MNRACDICHRRRIKCQYKAELSRCDHCEKLGAVCTFRRVPQKRGPAKRRTVSLENDELDPVDLYYRHIDGALPVVPMREGDFRHILQGSPPDVQRLFAEVVHDLLYGEGQLREVSRCGVVKSLKLVQLELTSGDKFVLLACLLLLCLPLQDILPLCTALGLYYEWCTPQGNTLLELHWTNIVIFDLALHETMGTPRVVTSVHEPLDQATQLQGDILRVFHLGVVPGSIAAVGGEPTLYKLYTTLRYDSSATLSSQLQTTPVNYGELIPTLLKVTHGVLKILSSVVQEQYTGDPRVGTGKRFIFAPDSILRGVDRIWTVVESIPTYVSAALSTDKTSSQEHRPLLSQCMNETVQITLLRRRSLLLGRRAHPMPTTTTSTASSPLQTWAARLAAAGTTTTPC